MVFIFKFYFPEKLIRKDFLYFQDPLLLLKETYYLEYLYLDVRDAMTGCTSSPAAPVSSVRSTARHSRLISNLPKFTIGATSIRPPRVRTTIRMTLSRR